MESKAGCILLLITAILTFLMSLIALLFIILLIISPDSVNSSQDLSPGVSILIISIGFLVFLILGFLQLYASRLMKNPATTKKGGIIGLIIGILMLNILAIIGGILGISQGGKNTTVNQTI